MPSGGADSVEGVQMLERGAALEERPGVGGRAWGPVAEGAACGAGNSGPQPPDQPRPACVGQIGRAHV